MAFSVSIDVNPHVIDWIINRIKNENIDNEILEQLRSWRDSDSVPRYTDIEHVSKKIHIPFGIFLLNKPPTEDKFLVEFRTLNNKKNEYNSLNLEETINKMRSIQSWMIDFKELEEEEPLDFINSLSLKDDYQTAANKIRDKLNLELDWNTKFSSPENLFRKIQEYFQNIGILFMKNKFVGVNVHHGRKLDVSEFRAFALCNNLAPLIFINQNDSFTGQVFSCFHELVHLFIGLNSLFNDSNINSNSHNQIETFCNNVAAEILVPKSLIENNWQEISGNLIEKVNNLAETYNVSRQVIIYRLANLNLINNNEKNQLLKLIKRDTSDFLADTNADKNEIIVSHFSKQKARMDKNFLKALKKSVNEGETSYIEAMHLTNSGESSFFNLMEKIN